ncbi:MAG TPA: hypothetical protein VGL94_21615, partial [Ktedonobacteraceae bacterium]
FCLKLCTVSFSLYRHFFLLAFDLSRYSDSILSACPVSYQPVQFSGTIHYTSGMKEYLCNLLNNARNTWLILALEIFGTAIIYASAKASGLPDSTSLILTCVGGSILILVDIGYHT